MTPLLNTADALAVGADAVEKVYLGADEVWTPPATGPTVIASDDFNRGDAIFTGALDGLIGQVTPVGGKTWLNLRGSGAWSNVSGHAVTNNGDNKAGIDTGVHDCIVQVDYYTGTSVQDGGLVLCYVDANNLMQVIVDPSGVYLQKFVAGAGSNVDHGGGAQAAGTRTLKAIIDGSSVKIYSDGALVVDTVVADAALLAGTKHGLLGSGAHATETWDNFLVTAVG